MKYRQFRILQAVSFMTNIPTYSHKDTLRLIQLYNVEFQSAQSLQKHCKIALFERFSLVDDILIRSCDQQLIRVYS